MAVAVRTNALFKKKTAAAAPAKKGKKAPAKRAAPAKEGSSLLGGLTDMFSTNADTLESRARSGSTAKGAQRSIGYRGSGQVGSAPQVDAQGNKAKFGGRVYRFGDKYGANIDEYAPIFSPEERSSTGDTYAGGALGLAVWFIGLVSLLGIGGFSIYSTSALG